MDNDDDFALADYFINYDYAPLVFGSGSSFLDPPVVRFGVEERFENFTLTENVDIIANDDTAVNEMVSESGEIRSEIIVMMKLEAR